MSYSDDVSRLLDERNEILRISKEKGISWENAVMEFRGLKNWKSADFVPKNNPCTPNINHPPIEM